MLQPEQLGFSFDNTIEEQERTHCPATVGDAIPRYRSLIGKHHAAMMAGDEDVVKTTRVEAHAFARKLNGDEPGILAGPDAPGSVLERVTAAEHGVVPLWGQTGDFTVTVGNMRVRIEQDGMFGIGSSTSVYPGFAAHAIDYDKPFLSETGYRSFLGLQAELVPNLTPDVFAEQIIAAYLQDECKGKSRKIGQTYVERELARRNEATRNPQRQCTG